MILTLSRSLAYFVFSRHHFTSPTLFNYPQPAMNDSNIIPFDEKKAGSVHSSKSMKSNLVVKASEIIEDPQVLVNVVSKRVAQLNQGRAPLIDTVPSMGAADIALTEIIEGKVVISQPEEN